MKLVVVGAGAAGMACATRAKRVNPEASVVVLEKGQLFSQGTCSLPYYLSGEVEADEVQAASAPELEAKGIELQLETQALEIHPTRKRIDTTQSTLDYDRLVVATGSKIKPFVHEGLKPGEPRVWTLRTKPEVDRIKGELQSCELRKIAIVGGGYVGVEFAEALCKLGRQVTLFQRSNRLMRLHPTLSDLARTKLESQGIICRLGCEVTGAQRQPDGSLLLQLSQEGQVREEHFDAVGLAPGIEPNTELLENAGARLGATGAVKISSRGETSLSSVYACGDGVELPNRYGGSGYWSPLATSASRLGRVCGENACGGSARISLNHSALALRMLGTQVATIGHPELWRDNQALEFDWGKDQHPWPARRAGRAILYADPSSQKLRGLQAIGPVAGELANLVSLAISQELSLECFQEQDFVYNPPIAHLWHPLYLAARKAKKQAGRGQWH